MSGTALACFGKDGTAARVYYIDESNVWEAGWNNGNWSLVNVTSKATGNPPRARNVLACFGIGGAKPRIYYFDAPGNVWELAWNDGPWSATNVTSRAAGNPPQAAPFSALTCFGYSGLHPRIYYFDMNGNLWELMIDGEQWYSGNKTSQAVGKPQPALFGKPISMFRS